MLVTGGVFYFFSKQRVLPELQREAVAAAHRYGDPAKSIDKVHVKLLYVVPQNQKNNEYAQSRWNELALKIEGALGLMARFHATQFRTQSSLTYSVYRKPVFLEHESDFYDSTESATGNPRALIAIAQEIERRVFIPDGDLFDESFTPKDAFSYPVLGLLYEGAGANGGSIYDSGLETAEEIAECLGISFLMVHLVEINSSDGFFLVSRNYLTDPGYQQSGTSVMYHEFGHALGLPDRYTDDVTEIDAITSDCAKEGARAQEIIGEKTNDIMGIGTYRPLEINYIDESLLKEMGITE